MGLPFTLMRNNMVYVKSDFDKGLSFACRDQGRGVQLVIVTTTIMKRIYHVRLAVIAFTLTNSLDF